MNLKESSPVRSINITIPLFSVFFVFPTVLSSAQTNSCRRVRAHTHTNTHTQSIQCFPFQKQLSFLFFLRSSYYGHSQ
jgi:hypothetical protein